MEDSLNEFSKLDNPQLIRHSFFCTPIQQQNNNLSSPFSNERSQALKGHKLTQRKLTELTSIKTKAIPPHMQLLEQDFSSKQSQNHSSPQNLANESTLAGLSSKELENNDIKSRIAPLFVRRLTPTRCEKVLPLGTQNVKNEEQNNESKLKSTEEQEEVKQQKIIDDNLPKSSLETTNNFILLPSKILSKKQQSTPFKHATSLNIQPHQDNLENTTKSTNQKNILIQDQDKNNLDQVKIEQFKQIILKKQNRMSSDGQIQLKMKSKERLIAIETEMIRAYQLAQRQADHNNSNSYYIDKPTPTTRGSPAFKIIKNLRNTSNTPNKNKLNSDDDNNISKEQLALFAFQSAQSRLAMLDDTPKNANTVIKDQETMYSQYIGSSDIIAGVQNHKHHNDDDGLSKIKKKSKLPKIIEQKQGDNSNNSILIQNTSTNNQTTQNKYDNIQINNNSNSSTEPPLLKALRAGLNRFNEIQFDESTKSVSRTQNQRIKFMFQRHPKVRLRSLPQKQDCILNNNNSCVNGIVSNLNNKSNEPQKRFRSVSKQEYISPSEGINLENNSNNNALSVRKIVTDKILQLPNMIEMQTNSFNNNSNLSTKKKNYYLSKRGNNLTRNTTKPFNFQDLEPWEIFDKGLDIQEVFSQLQDQ